MLNNKDRKANSVSMKNQLKSDIKVALSTAIVLFSGVAIAQNDDNFTDNPTVKNKTGGDTDVTSPDDITKGETIQEKDAAADKTEQQLKATTPGTKTQAEKDKADNKTQKEKSIDRNSSESDIKKAVKKEATGALDKATIEAGSLSYDKETKTLTAEDNVVMGYKDREIKAQRIDYNQDSRLITADNGVQYKDSSNTVFSAKNIIVTDQFDKGEMRDVRADFGDGSSFNADNLTILDVNKYNLADSTYTPCDMCLRNKPVWQVDSKKTVYDESTGRVTYKDVYLKVLGHKVMWLPYISHPTPFAKSKSGFLSPKFGQSSEFGFFARIPYYYQPAQNIDFTFTPFLTSKDGPIMIVEHRHLMENGEYLIEVSGANPRKLDDNGEPIPGAGNEFRGHIKTKGDFNYLENWKLGWDATRSTDDTYLRRYKLGGYEDVLTSELHAIRVKDRDNTSIKALAFQGLREDDDPAISPIVAPLIDGQKVYSLSDNYDQRLTAKYDTMVLKRDEGADSTRVIGAGRYTADYLSSAGHIFNAAVEARQDFYDVNNVPVNATLYDGTVTRTIPTASMTWSYPVQKLGETYGLVLEPVAMVVASPNGTNTKRIPNEDSQNIEITDYNLFQENHISGNDIIEEGFRSNYGMKGVLTTDSWGDYNFLFGQNFRATKDTETFGPDSGMEDNFSDYVGRVVTGSKNVQTSYRFRVDKDSFEFRRNEISLDFNLSPVQLSTAYTFLDGLAPNPDRQEIYSGTTIKLTDTINLLANARRNLNNDDSAGWVNVGGGIQFKNKCLDTSFEINREFTRDRDIQPSTDFVIKFNLANFGS